ncbi:MAG: glycerol-3-phosphate dehydrogenase [Gammaproteobacteria bacterium]|nr:glycerol-3-phosphate dehydrogenase [Gammaproteobacteria bacterium]
MTTDLLVIGGGINGAGVARDAAGRGLRVFLCEKDDLAQHTSSASTKLIHGGLRYLEYYDFALVRHALKEREVLLRSAPHIIWPLRFVLPYHRGLRARWMIRAGLFLYDYLGGRKLLPASCSLDLTRHPAGEALKSVYTTGFEYSDCWVQDSRLVTLCAMDARARGAVVKTRTRCVALQRRQDHWLARLKESESGREYQVKARALVNAAGPWVEQVLDLGQSLTSGHRVRLVKGSHVVVPRLFDHEYPYLFQHHDGRVLFAIPYEKQFTLLGTTDIEVNEIGDKTEIDSEEIRYICEAASGYFKQTVVPGDVVWSYSGVRPLHDDAAGNASKVTRDYNLFLDTREAPIVSVFGGKITTHRRLAEEVMGLLAEPLGISTPDWTASNHLPGGDIPDADYHRFLQTCTHRYSWMPRELLRDYTRNYGTRVSMILEGCDAMEDLGRHFEGPLYQREVEYLMDQEFACTADDVLWRRSRKGLFVSEATARDLDDWMGGERPDLSAGKL